MHRSVQDTMQGTQQRHVGKMLQFADGAAKPEPLLPGNEEQETSWNIHAVKAPNKSYTLQQVSHALGHAAPLLYLTATSTMITLIAQVFNDQVQCALRR